MLLEGKNRREGAAGWRWGMGACPAPPGLWGLSGAHPQGTPKPCSWERGWGSQGPCVHPCLSLLWGPQGDSAGSSLVPLSPPTAGAEGLQDPPYQWDVPLAVCPAEHLPPALSPQTPPAPQGREGRDTCTDTVTGACPCRTDGHKDSCRSSWTQGKFCGLLDSSSNT